jgi:hypothetical protein
MPQIPTCFDLNNLCAAHLLINLVLDPLRTNAMSLLHCRVLASQSADTVEGIDPEAPDIWIGASTTS